MLVFRNSILKKIYLKKKQALLIMPSTPEQREQWRLQREKHKEQRHEYAKKYYELNKESELERTKQWRELNPDKVRENNKKSEVKRLMKLT